ncbi:MAG TPA: undecaprenyl-diphosphate phosphatase [Solirubrobacteraceae bacterium]|nr:undecaprenyl-diphosphate phosphatase [Solirubrobacteraceae bacterium]
MRRAERELPLRQAVALGLLQGPTELLPVSSSAHTTLLPWLAGWSYGDLDDELRKGFEVALHAGTATALVLLAGRELAGDTAAMLRRRPRALMLALAPPALAGLLLGPRIERDLGEPPWIALALAAGSVAMAGAELRGRRAPGQYGGRHFGQEGAADGLALGLAQALALVPGISRSGASIGAARWRGFTREDAHRLSWTVALPVIAGASLLQGLRLRRVGIPASMGASMAAGAGAAFCSTLGAGALLRGRLRGCPPWPFVLYRGALAGWVALRANARR